MDNSINVIIPQMMPTLFAIFTYDGINERNREKLLILLYLVITQFSYADGVDNKLVTMCFDETYDLWISLFISAL